MNCFIDFVMVIRREIKKNQLQVIPEKNIKVFWKILTRSLMKKHRLKVRLWYSSLSFTRSFADDIQLWNMITLIGRCLTNNVNSFHRTLLFVPSLKRNGNIHLGFFKIRLKQKNNTYLSWPRKNSLLLH